MAIPEADMNPVPPHTDQGCQTFDSGVSNVSRRGPFTRGGKSRILHLTESWVGPRSGAECSDEKKSPSPSET